MDYDSDCPPILLEEEDERLTTISRQEIPFSIWKTFKQHIPRFLITIFVDAVLPFVIYLILRERHQTQGGQVMVTVNMNNTENGIGPSDTGGSSVRTIRALLLAGIPPLIMVTIKAIISRTFDALGFLVFTAFAASAIAALITHNPIIILLEKSLVTCLTSLIFGITLIPFSCCHWRPLAYYFYQDLVPTKRADVGLPDIVFEDEQELMIDESSQEENFIPKLTHKQEVSQVYEWIYAHCSSFRSACYIITSIWAVGLLLEFLAKLLLILFHLSVDTIFIYGHIILTLMTSVLILLTIICITNERKRTLKSIENWKREYLN